MSTWIICIILLICIVIGIKSYAKRLTSGCCGTGGPKSVKKVKVADKHPEHYFFEAILTIDGMTCGNCAAKVENALNVMEGVWASVDLSMGQAKVRMKSRLSDNELKKAVQEAGYTVLKIME